MSVQSRILRRSARPAALLALALCCLPRAALAAGGDCAALFELYRNCHSRGAQADGSQACLGNSQEALARALAKTARKNAQAAQVLVELVCGTGCDDAVCQREPATRQEFTEAFCE